MKYLLILILAGQTWGGEIKLDRFFAALAKVESNNNPNAIGDLDRKGNPRALGLFQIWEIYFKDAVQNPRIRDKYKLNTVKYRDVLNPEVARRVCLAYFTRYEPAAIRDSNFEVLARLHNAGPGWRKKIRLTDDYWQRIVRAYGNP
jgi:hypothetical protein